MADQKLSQLTAASTVNDADLLLLTQSGASVSATRAQVLSVNVGASTAAAARAALSAPFGDSVVHVDDPAYGAVGDGATDDTLAIRAAVATGKNVQFTPGRTYLLSGGLVGAAYQCFHGGGATLKRCNQLSATTTSAIANGSTSVSVAAVGGLKVGMDVVVSAKPITNGAISGLVDYDVQSRTISAIVGTTVTVSSPWITPLASGAVMYSTGVALTLGTGGRAHDLVFDGNRANQTWYRWEVSQAVFLLGDGSHVEGCTIHDSPSEGVYMGGNDTSVLRCIVTNCNGNGVHMGTTISGGSTGPTSPNVRDCRIMNVNLDQNAGHVMGCVGWSADVVDANVSGCYLVNGVCGLGNIANNTSSDCSLANNTIRNCTTAGIQAYSLSSNIAPVRTAITGNRIYACPIGVSLAASGSTTVFSGNAAISGNYIDGSTTNSIFLSQARNVAITGNVMVAPLGAAAIHLNIVDSSQVVVSGNDVQGGNGGAFVNNAAGAMTNVLVVGNEFAGQKGYGVQFGGSNAPGCSIKNNVIANDATQTSGTYSGIVTRGQTSVVGNTLSLSTNGGLITSVRGLQSSLLGSPGALIQGNEFLGSANFGILLSTNSGGNVVANNSCESSISSAFSISNTNVTTFGKFTFTVVSGAITAVTVVSGGVYSSAPTLFATDPSGTGATFTCNMTGTAVTSVTVTAGGSGYTAPVAGTTGNIVGTNWVTP